MSVKWFLIRSFSALGAIFSAYIFVGTLLDVESFNGFIYLGSMLACACFMVLFAEAYSHE